MGWWQRTFSNSPAARLERAEIFWTNAEYNKVRLEVEDLTDARAQDLYNLSLERLVALNLDEAHARFSLGDSTGAEEHLMLAKEFGHQIVKSKKSVVQVVQSNEWI